jgi:hypothetical protein
MREGVNGASNLRVHWFRIITDLERSGYSQAAIGAAIGTPKSTMHGWKQGASPKYEDGYRLIALWSRVTGSSPQDIPRISKYDFRA